jgi:Flp pilus assembly protein TadD
MRVPAFTNWTGRTLALNRSPRTHSSMSFPLHGSTSSPRDDRPWVWLGIAVIIMAGFGVYFRSVTGPFLFDDIPGVVENESIRDLGDIGRVLNPPAEGAGIDSRPIINLSLALNHALGGLDPRGYRLTNVGIHVFCALVLFGLVRRTLALPATPEHWREAGLPTAFCAALLWTVHPLQSETVICVIQRTESIVSLWYLLALYCFARAGMAGGNRCWLASAWTVCLLGMASKEVMASAPLLLFLYDRTFLSGSFRAAWQMRGRWHLAFASTWVLLAWLVVDSGGNRGGTAGFDQGVSAWTYLLTQARALALYLKLSVWPHPLIVDYGSWLAPGLRAVFWEALFVISLLGLTAWAIVRRPRLGFLGALFFAVLAPSSSFYPLVSQTIAEHRMHLPLAPVVLLIVLGLFQLPWRMATGVALIAALAAGLVTMRRGADYASELTLWTDLTAKAPGNPWAHFNLGKTHFQQGRFHEAEQANRIAILLQPTNADFHFALGLALERQWRGAEAIASYRRALELKPTYAEAYIRSALVLLATGRAAEAVPFLREAVRLRPDHADAVGNLGAALFQLGLIDEAMPHFERVIALQPESVDARYNLALLLIQQGRTSDALPLLEEAARLKPTDREIQATLERLRPGQRPHSR